MGEGGVDANVVCAFALALNGLLCLPTKIDAIEALFRALLASWVRATGEWFGAKGEWAKEGEWSGWGEGGAGEGGVGEALLASWVGRKGSGVGRRKGEWSG